MRYDDELEKKMSGTPKPGVREGHHKSLLKRELINGFAAPGKKEVRKPMKMRTALILAMVGVLIIATAAWAYNRMRTYEVIVHREGDVLQTSVTDETGETKEYTMEVDPNATGPIIVSIDEETGEPVIQNHLPKEIQDAIDAGNYTVTEEVSEDCDGETVTLYHYKIDLGDDKKVELNVPYRLEELDSGE